MCTAVSWRGNGHWFGRTLDLECSFGERVTITPRRYPFSFRRMGERREHYAIIGMARVSEGYPLYYDGVNEKGLCMAGLNFPGYAVYRPAEEGRDNIAPFELIPWILGGCASVGEAEVRLERVNLTRDAFGESLPLTPLHWIIADGERAVTVEAGEDGVRVLDNRVGVLTNSPPFDVQLLHLSGFMDLSSQPPENRLAPGVELMEYSRGMGAMGLPGDWSSPSRFVRAAFALHNAERGEGEEEQVSRLFHMLGTVAVPEGCVRLKDGGMVTTRYTSCCGGEGGTYYYTTCENRQITAVELFREDVDGEALSSYPLIREERIRRENGNAVGKSEA